MDYVTGAKLDQAIELLDTIRLLEEKQLQQFTTLVELLQTDISDAAPEEPRERKVKRRET